VRCGICFGVHDYRKLDVWTMSQRFVRDLYLATQSFPTREQFGLTRQLRRAAVSIPSNIAEGAGRGGRKEFARFIRIAAGSACEVDTHLQIGLDLGYLDFEQHARPGSVLETIKARLGGLERSLTAKP